jgi:hypothetical protein
MGFYTDLLADARNAVAALTKKMTEQSYSKGGLSIIRQDLAKAREHLLWCEQQAAIENGTLAGQTLARPDTCDSDSDMSSNMRIII